MKTTTPRQILYRRYYRRHRSEIRDLEQRRRKLGNLWWLEAAFIKSGGSPLDWPQFRTEAA